ncbi:hypothetical protein D9619_010657 [Psilocybe cf. subviscida]|uniref:Uncharacterized protein n=1 Tax=Psilocybe cf. subviscida TaxID=2480587 RepID=A0A8H5B8Y6_9AGAR|nr:hypothetical protein D9619_010657 [Psilocybe cf. subviscida]
MTEDLAASLALSSARTLSASCKHLGETRRAKRTKIRTKRAHASVKESPVARGVNATDTFGPATPLRLVAEWSHPILSHIPGVAHHRTPASPPQVPLAAARPRPPRRDGIQVIAPSSRSRQSQPGPSG